jgi:DNA-binding CsgD family transcriptional regulator
VRDTFETGRRLYVIIEEVSGERRRPAGKGGLAMIEQVLLGDSAKVVAIDRQVSQSTVALAVRSRLRMMGLSCKLRALPLILVMAARAACSPQRGIVVGRMAVMPAPFRGRVISVEQPDFRLAEELSNSERSVLLQIMDGKSYVQVARVRRTSTRTVANQLGSVFRKLGVSGYGQTLDLLLSRTLGGGACVQP